jgi:hypothetical protein
MAPRSNGAVPRRGTTVCASGRGVAVTGRPRDPARKANGNRADHDERPGRRALREPLTRPFRLVGDTGIEPVTSSVSMLIGDQGAAVAVLFSLVGSGPADACCRCAASGSTRTDDFSMTMRATLLTVSRLSQPNPGAWPFDRGREFGPVRVVEAPPGVVSDQDLPLPAALFGRTPTSEPESPSGATRFGLVLTGGQRLVWSPGQRLPSQTWPTSIPARSSGGCGVSQTPGAESGPRPTGLGRCG